MKRAAILARVSTKEQATADRHSIPIQVEQGKEAVSRLGFELARVFEIPGETAWSSDVAKKRPEFDAAIRAGERGEYDALFVYDFSRFARNQYVAHWTLERLRKVEVEVYDFAGNEFTKNPMLAGVFGMVTEMQVSDHSRKVRDAYRRRFECGLPTGDIPFGYRNVKTDSPPAVVPEEGEAILWAFRQYANGVGYFAIADEFNCRGLKPRSKRGYQAFVPSSVQRILTNRFYAGFIRHGQEERRGAHEPIITEGEFDAAAARIRHFRKGTTENTLLMGIARCMTCGGPVWVNGSGPRASRYYWEPSRLQHRECAAKDTYWRTVDVDNIVEACMLQVIVPQDRLERAYRDAKKAEGMLPGREQIIAERKRLGDLYRRGVIDEAEWGKEDQVLAQRLEAVSPQVTDTLHAIHEFESFVAAWADANQGERREAVRHIMRYVEVDTAGKNPKEGIRFHPKEKFLPIFRWANEAVLGSTPERTGALPQRHGFSPLELGFAA